MADDRGVQWLSGKVLDLRLGVASSKTHRISSVMCPSEQDTIILNPGKCPDMTEKLLTGTLQMTENHDMILPSMQREIEEKHTQNIATAFLQE